MTAPIIDVLSHEVPRLFVPLSAKIAVVREGFSQAFPFAVVQAPSVACAPLLVLHGPYSTLKREDSASYSLPCLLSSSACNLRFAENMDSSFCFDVLALDNSPLNSLASRFIFFIEAGK